MEGRISKGVCVIVFFVLILAWIPKLHSASDTVLAKVGEIVITQGDLDEYLSRYAQMKKGNPFTPEEKKVHLNNIIKGTLITMEAEREKLDQNPDFKARLKIYRSDLLIQEYVSTKIQPHVKVTEKDVEEKLKENPNLLPKETLSLKEIVVKTEKEAAAIYQDLKKGGDFGKIAGEKSTSPTKVHGGSLRPVSRGQLPKPLEDAAFNLKKEEFSKPVKVNEEYHILYLVDRKERSPEEMKRLEGIIKEKIGKIEESKKIQEMIEKKAEEVKKSTKVETYYDRIK